MVMTYRRPGVYLEESLLVNPADTAGTITVAAFVGVAGKGPINEPTLCESWSSYVTLFGDFSPISVPVASLDVTNRLGTPVPATLADLKADATQGDGHYSGAPFTAGQFVTLPGPPGVTTAHCEGTGAASVWTAGAMSGTPSKPPPVLSYLPHAVYSFFQNGGRFAWIIRSVDEIDSGEHSMVVVNGQDDEQDDLASFTIVARSVGTWGNTIKYELATQQVVPPTGEDQEAVFTLRILVKNSQGRDEIVETWPALSVRGTLPSTRRVDAAINDPAAGSQYVRIIDVNTNQPMPEPAGDAVSLADGVDPGVPLASTLTASATDNVPKLEGPITVNIVGYSADAGQANGALAANNWVSASVSSSSFPDRQDIFIINDSAPPRLPGASSGSYKTTLQSAYSVTGDSYSAAYGPWIIVPDPTSVGHTITIPPGGAVMGMMARIDATVGVFRAPAGVIAGLSNAVGVQTKFTDTELGDLNAGNINIVRSVVGAGICVMGGRTRKTYGTDRYISARRTLIYIKEVMRRSTQFAVFENNDQRLWSSLRMAGERVLRPLWEAGGLRGANASEAYFVRCDSTLNTLSVIASGEVRMEMGVALEYPAEFVIIRVTQYDQGTFSTEISPAA